MKMRWISSTSTVSQQDLEKSVRLGSFLLVLISALAIFLTRRMPISSFLLMICTVAGWSLSKDAFKSGLWEIASFLYLLFFFFDLFRLSGALAPALVHLFIFIIINKIFNLNTPRDFQQLYLLTFLTILAASSLSVETEMFYVIVFYIIFLVWNIVSLTLLMEARREGSARTIPFHLFSFTYCFMIVLTAVVAFVIAVGIFFILPRMQLGYFSAWNAGKVQHVSGFSQKVTLGDIPGIQDDTSLAMRVRVTPLQGVSPERYYWRGMAFDHYDGKSWSNAFPRYRFLAQDSSGFFQNLPDRKNSGLLIKQEFYSEPLDTRVIFGADHMVKVRGDFSGVSRDNNSGLTGMNRSQTYEVYSRVPVITKNALRLVHTDLPESIKKYYVQLPAESESSQVLAEKITAKAVDDVDRVYAVKEYLESNYAYITQDLPEDAKDPIHRFLFERKAGHCQYFATAMVLLLRHLGIPARLVNGFLQGEYNEIGGFYAVRNTDAHSWVEVYLGGMWAPFDPSPRPLSGASQTFSALLSLQKIFESIGFFWDRYVLIFSAQDQIDALTAARDKYRKLNSHLRHTYGALPADIVTGFLFWWNERRNQVALILIASLAVFLIYLFVQRRRAVSKINRSPILFYQHMLVILRKKGLNKRPESTPNEFLSAVSSQLPTTTQQDVELLTQLFYKSRFGNYLLTPADTDHVRACLLRLEQR
jgi:protein-glutamine gamma-glutamyltransferase